MQIASTRTPYNIWNLFCQLFVWLEDPKNKLTVENALPRIEPPHNGLKFYLIYVENCGEIFIINIIETHLFTTAQ